ncbi:MAG: hypothetical protein IIX92_07115 [Selenomonadales bacterium]|nr:hypothetical protein [Selenomonadales bacterium]
MKKPSRTVRPAVDADHLAKLHHEASAILSLFCSSLTCAASSDGEIRDMLDNMAQDHLSAYLDLLHTISLHDATIGTHFSVPPTTPPILSLSRQLRLQLAEALLLRHKRLESLALTGDSRRFYQDDTLTKEKEHLSTLVHLLTV